MFLSLRYQFDRPVSSGLVLLQVWAFGWLYYCQYPTFAMCSRRGPARPCPTPRQGAKFFGLVFPGGGLNKNPWRTQTAGRSTGRLYQNRCGSHRLICPPIFTGCTKLKIACFQPRLIHCRSFLCMIAEASSCPAYAPVRDDLSAHAETSA